MRLSGSLCNLAWAHASSPSSPAWEVWSTGGTGVPASASDHMYVYILAATRGKSSVVTLLYVSYCTLHITDTLLLAICIPASCYRTS